MDIVVEMSGLARILSNARHVTLTVDDATTYQDIVRMLAERYPPLLGQVIDQESLSLYPSNMISLDGKRMVQPDQMDEHPQDGDRLVLMTILAGG